MIKTTAVYGASSRASRDTRVMIAKLSFYREPAVSERASPACGKIDLLKNEVLTGSLARMNFVAVVHLFFFARPLLVLFKTDFPADS